MDIRLKPLKDQVIVLTGASSGIGLVTARMAAQRGARLMLTARNETALLQLTQELNGSESVAGVAAFVAGDIAEEDVVRRVGSQAIGLFGRIDTWINCAGVSIYGPALDVSLEDQRRLFETNFWGVVLGSRIAVGHLRKTGGALINIGSTLSDRAIPLQGIYCASKHAVKAYTDSLRMELEHEGLPISVTLIKPGSIDTPYAEHAKNYLPNEPENPLPAYAPEVVAETILYCAEHPVRDVFAGGGGKILSMLGHWVPRLADRMMEGAMFDLQQSDRADHDRNNNGLYGPARGLQERGGRALHVAETSLYTQASLSPMVTAAVMAVAGASLVLLFRRGASAGRHPVRRSNA
ncbi:MAG: SDR family oxidoreductase [Nitrospira sp.]